jgi:hypothetical protein
MPIMSASLGHQCQDVLENAGMPSEKARELAHAVAELTQKHFLAVAADLEANGFSRCALALRLECNTFFAS